MLGRRSTVSPSERIRRATLFGIAKATGCHSHQLPFSVPYINEDKGSHVVARKMQTSQTYSTTIATDPQKGREDVTNRGVPLIGGTTLHHSSRLLPHRRQVCAAWRDIGYCDPPLTIIRISVCTIGSLALSDWTHYVLAHHRYTRCSRTIIRLSVIKDVYTTQNKASRPRHTWVTNISLSLLGRAYEKV